MTARILVLFALVSTAAVADAGLALVGNENGGTISLIDTARDEVVGEIKTGGKPRGTAIHAERTANGVQHTHQRLHAVA